MAISEVRTQIYLERAQHSALKRAARARGVSMAQVVREAIARHLAAGHLADRDESQVDMIAEATVPYDAGVRATRQVSDADYLADLSWRLVEVADAIGAEGPGDAAENLDHYLYGKRRKDLSSLLSRVNAGEEVLIAESGEPIARLVPLKRQPHRVLGQDEGLFEVPEDFDDALPEEVLASFEG